MKSAPLTSLVLSFSLLACGGNHSAAPTVASSPSIQVLSSDPSRVSGESTLVQVDVPAGAAAPTLMVNGTAASASLVQISATSYQGVVTNLNVGPNTLAATTGNSAAATLAVTDYPIAGPIFSGPHLQPWACTTAAAGLGAATDVNCSAPTQYFYFYMSTDPTKTSLQPYDPTAPASDVAMTTTDAGATVPFIVRNERGVINRGVYDIALLFDPTKPWTATSPQSGWSHKLFFRFGAGCGASYASVANSAQATDNAFNALGRGFAVATSGLFVLGNQCNTIVGAETVSMVKEQLIKSYGTVRYTMVDGQSGASIMMHLIANSYPGLLDGLMPGPTAFPEIWSEINEAADCGA